MKILLSGNFRRLHFPPATKLSAGGGQVWLTLSVRTRTHRVVAGLKINRIGLSALLLEMLHLSLFSFGIRVGRDIFFLVKNNLFITGLRKAFL